jgi:hypothetical protein
MKFNPALALSLVAAATAFDASATDLVALEWSADGAFAKAWTVPAGKFLEACGQLPAKAEVKWRFQAGAPMNFNIHFHEGEQVHYPARQAGVAKADGTLDVKVDQDYCWMWTNTSGSDVALTVELTRR